MTVLASVDADDPAEDEAAPEQALSKAPSDKEAAPMPEYLTNCLRDRLMLKSLPYAQKFHAYLATLRDA